MIRYFRACLLAVFAASAVAACHPAFGQGETGTANARPSDYIIHSVSPDPVVITTTAGRQHSFVVELALTAAEQSQGLMYRDEMADDKGMLFPYRRPDYLSFWMRNTRIPLDIIFVTSSGRIANIITADPMTDTPRRSKGRAIAVLELRGGLAAELGIAPGDRVTHPLIGN